MLGWSIPLFRIRGIQLSLHSSFLLLLGYFAWTGWGEGRAAGAFWNSATLIAFFACVVLHELGHSFTAMRFGIGVRRILLMPIGGMAEFDGIPREPSRELWMTLAGPAVNFAIAGLLWPVVHASTEPFALFSLRGLLYQILWGNIGMGTFNLLPAFPMDGGRIFRALLAMRLPYLTATRWAARTGKALCILGVIFALSAPLLGWTENPLWLLAALFTFIFFAGELELRAVERREREDAHWHTTLARLSALQTPPVLVPPLLREEAERGEPPFLSR